MQPGEITYLDLRPDSWQSYVEREEYMDSSADKLAKLKARAEALDAVFFGRVPEQAKLPLATIHVERVCAKCGRAFTAPGQYRYRGADGAAICRDARACAVRAEGK